VAFTPEQLAILERQRAYFASDDRIKERAEIWRDATPEECLAATWEACNEAEVFLQMKTPEELERVLAPDPLPPDAIAILERLRRC
jgi:hypothetical protein